MAISLVRAGVGGTISMSGGFTNFAGGSVAIEIGGSAAGQFGRITINGSAALTGTLNLFAVNGFDPALNSTFNVFTYTAHTGQFDTVNGSLGNGKQFTVTYGASGLTVNTVAASPLPTPAPPLITPSIKKVDDNFHIEFQSIAGRSYRIEWTDDLKAGHWTVLTREAIVGTGELIKVIDAGAGTQKQGFYRVVETQAAAMNKP